VIPTGDDEDEDALLDGAEDVKLPVIGEGKGAAILPNVLRNLV